MISKKNSSRNATAAGRETQGTAPRAKAAHPVSRAILEQRWVDNPLRTPATYLEELRHAAEREQGKTDGIKATSQPGKIPAAVNMGTLIGGFARVRDRTEAQAKAAARYRSTYERAQLGGSRAVDYAAVKVDTSGPTVTIFELGEEARREYRELVKLLGMDQSSLVEQVVCHDMSVRDVALSRGHGESGAARGEITRRLVEAIDALADHFGYSGASQGSRKSRRWDDGSTETMLFTGEIRNPKRGKG